MTLNCVLFVGSPGLLDQKGRWETLQRRMLGMTSGGVEVPTSRLVNDPLLVYCSLRFYRRHPEHRGELSDGRALRRLAAGELLG